ncbi:ATP synthase subunit [Gongronella butleri]|nr:ATP synthase subunit [Gongronella butleri]
MNELLYNERHGFIDAILRGYRSGMLSQSHYMNLTQCETLEDLRLQIGATDYGTLLQNEPSPIATSTISERLTQRLVEEFEYIRSVATQPLSKFLDYITYQYMIDNVILLITGTLHERDTHELLERCHPLGVFESMPALCVATTVAELYNTVLVETPLAPYFANCLSAHDLDELNIEIIRNTLYKAYLEDFYQFCQSLDGRTGEVMGEILNFEADRRTVNITINSFGTELTKDDRKKLFPSMGRLFPEGHARLALAEEVEQVKAVCDVVHEYRGFFDAANDKTLEDRFFEQETLINRMAFQQQFNFGIFYAYVKLVEHQVRLITFIAECISQGQKDRIPTIF